MLQHLLVHVDHDGAAGAGGGEGKGQPGKSGQHLDVEHLGAAAGKPDEVGGHPSCEARLLHRQTQSENAQQKISDGLREAVQRHVDVVHGVDQHQGDDADQAGHGDVEGFRGPQHHGHGHHRQGPLSLIGEPFGVGRQDHC